MKLTVTVTLLLLLLSPLPARCTDYPDMLLILDSSGSMWGQIGGKSKMAIAKEALTNLVGTLPQEIHLGLMAYGHRQKADCKDIELLIPPGPLNRTAITERIAALSPKGKTPLSDSLRMAAQTLRSTESAASVILITDGLETCDKDPCRVAADLAMGGVDFTVHVIGFDLSKGDQDRVRCIADKTHGIFVAAGDAAALQSALSATVKKAGEPPPAVVEDPGTATLDAPKEVVVGETFKVGWQGPDSRDDYLCLARTDTDDRQCIDHSYTEQGNPSKLTAKCEAGSYQLRYVYNHTDRILATRDIKVLPVRVELNAPAEADAATPVAVTWKGPGYPTDYIAVSKPEDSEHGYLFYTYTQEGSSLNVPAPSEPGTYEIRYVLGAGDRVLARRPIRIREVTARLEAPAEAAAASRFPVRWEGPANPPDYLSIAKTEDDGSGYFNYAYTQDGNPAMLTAPPDPGTYEVRYVLGQDSVVLVRRKITVTGVDARLQAPSSVPMGKVIDVTWQGPNESGDYISIATPEGGGDDYITYEYTDGGSPVRLQAPTTAGAYEIRYVLGLDSKVLCRQPLQVERVHTSVAGPASAPADTEISVSWQGPDAPGDYISLARPGDEGSTSESYEYTSAGNPVTLRTPGPGEYEIRYITGDNTAILDKAPISVK